MKLTLRNVLALAALTAFALPADGASISWSSTAFTNMGTAEREMGTGQLDTTGTQILADNTGGGAEVYDGISYTAGAVTFNSTYNGFHNNNANAEVSRTGAYGPNNSTGTVTLGSGGVGTIVPGNTYRVQLLMMDGRSGQNGRTVEVDGVLQGQYANGGGGLWGDSLLVTGTFTADANSQAFTIEAFDGSSSLGGHLNALLLHQVAIPEPTSFLLLGAATIGFVGIRRQR